jgi:eukaryotic-like serine/threonine-protein kinase
VKVDRTGLAAEFDAERLFEDFEAGWSSDALESISSLVASWPAERQCAVLGELVRLDLELRTGAGLKPRLEDYLDRFDLLKQDEDVLAGVVFEHFRLQCESGLKPDPVAYQQQFGVDTRSWQRATQSRRGAEVSAEKTGETCEPAIGKGLGTGGAGQPAPFALAQQLPEPAQRDADGFPVVPGLFAGHELVGVLGEGAFSRVFLARQGDLARRFVTLKVTREASDEPDCLARLQHTSIVPIYSVHRDGPLQAICMPFLGSLTLADLVGQLPRDGIKVISGRELISTAAARWLETRRDAGGPESVSAIALAREAARPVRALGSSTQRATRVDPDSVEARFEAIGDRSFGETAAWLFRQLAEGLEHAHNQGIVHGDIKPANILIGDDGHPLLLDFNLARKSGEGASGFVGGTLAYMAPEQLRGYDHGLGGDERSDLYSLGLVMHELLAGQRAFPDRSGTLAEVISSMVSDRAGKPPSLHGVRPAIDRDLCQILAKCLEHDPAQRYPSAAALVEDLRRREEFLPLRTAEDRSPWHRMKKWTRRHPRVASLGSVITVAAVLLGLALAGWLVRGRQLERIAAREASAEFVSRLQRQALPLTGLGLPETMKDSALLDLKETLAANEASEPQQLERSARFQSLSGKDRQQERRSVATTWFLMAERLLDQANRMMPGPGTELLDEAARLNEIARQIRQGLDDSPAIEFQSARLNALKAGRELPATSGQELALNIADADPADIRLTAIELVRRREFGPAVEFLRRWVKAEPDDAGAWLLLGNAEAGSGRLADAEAAFGICLALDDSLEIARFNRGLARRDRGDIAGAIADFGEAIRINPLEPGSRLNRGQLRLASGDAKGALVDFDEAIKLGTADTRVWYYLTRAHRALGNESSAAESAQRFLEEEPANTEGWALRGFVRHQAGDLDGAMNDYGRALELEPTLQSALQSRANILAEQKNQPAAAIADLDRIVAARPGDPVALVTRGVLHARIGDRAKAHADAEAALQLSQAGDTLYRAAGVYALTSQLEPADRDRAIALIAAALLRDPAAVEKYWADDRDLEPIADDEGLKQLREWVAKMRELSVPKQ